MPPTRNAWERTYRNRSRCWAGPPPLLPLPGAGNRNVLEIGCGDGHTLIRAAGIPGLVVGLDFSRNALSMCRSRTILKRVADLCVADAVSIPFRDGCFDLVIAHHVIGHSMADGRRAMADEISRVMASGGLLFFQDFSTGDMRRGSGTAVERETFLRGGGIITHYFDRAEVENLFSKLHLDVLSEHTWHIKIRGEIMPRAEIRAVFRKALS